MNTHGFPNDFIRLINPVSILILLPIVNYFVYPTLRRLRIPFPPVSRMIFGFTVETLAMAYAGITQHLVYSSGPCYSHPRACPAAMTPNGAIPNNINVFVQVPVYVIEGFGDMFCVAAGYEYAYNNSPVSMKTLVPAVFMFTATVGTLLGLALTPLYQDPRLVILFILLASSMGTVTAMTWVWQRWQKSKEEEFDTQGENSTTGSGGSVVTTERSERVSDGAEDKAAR
jgi:POT family proton-dependent oligopeptide transporter